MKNEKNHLFALLIFLSFSVTALAAVPENDQKKVDFSFKPGIGLTLNKTTSNGVSSTAFQWQATLSSDLNIKGEKFDFSSSLYAAYGESRSGGETEKTQDVLILSLTPSVRIIKRPAIRLFLETTGETTMAKGTLNNQPTGFLDPLFLYQTLFIGQKHYSPSDSKNTTWNLTYGVGYACQQTLNRNFVPIQVLGGGNSDFESGMSGIVDFGIDSKISEGLTFNADFKAVILTRSSISAGLPSSRRSVLLRSGIFYRQIGLEYNFHFIQDPNLSLQANIDHSLMFTFRF